MLNDAMSSRAAANLVQEAGICDNRQVTSAADAALTTGIFFATETGASEDVAKALASASQARGLRANVHDLAETDVPALMNLDVALFICSTTGDGDVPYAAEGFFKQLAESAAQSMNHLRYAVLALGDSSYEHFCAAGIKLDTGLASLGAAPLLPRVDCDTDYEDIALTWRDDVLAKLVRADTAPARHAIIDVEEARRDKYGLVAATVCESRILTRAGSTKATRHLALEFSDGLTRYEPGDALGIVVENDAATVRAVLQGGGFSGSELISIKDEMMPLERALRCFLEITTVTPRFIAAWAALSRAESLLALGHESTSAARAAFMHANHVVDVMRTWPSASLGPDALGAMLRPLQPRLYSIASTIEATPGQVHLAIAPVAYDLHGERRCGVATGQLCERISVGASLQVYVQPNAHFRLPAPETSIVMIGAGTGIAPYRSFLQHREAQGATGGAWLFFGERNRASDFLYEEDVEHFRAKHVLTHLDTAYSRDDTEKFYVQNRLIERAKELAQWIVQGAHVFVCGDAARMAPDVHAALIEALKRGLDIGGDAAVAYLAAMQREGRYQRDVY